MKREDFPILTELVNKRPLVYLDNAATTQKPQVVLDGIVEAYSKWNANVHRGVHHLSQVSTQKHEEARKIVAEFIHAQTEEEIIFTKGTTDSINTLAWSFGEVMVKEGDEIEIVLPEPKEYEVEAENIPLDVVYEDSDIIVVKKASLIGLEVHLSTQASTLNYESANFWKQQGPTWRTVLPSYPELRENEGHILAGVSTLAER